MAESHRSDFISTSYLRSKPIYTQLYNQESLKSFLFGSGPEVAGKRRERTGITM